MRENEISGAVVDAAFQIHSQLGPGLLETVYEVLLAHALQKRGMSVQRQKPVPIVFGGVRFEEGFRADLIVDNLIIVELKSVEALSRVHGKQLLTYLKLTNLRLGLLINFGAFRLKDGIHRVVNGLPESPPTL